jgi:hypothetical protein
VITVAGGSGGTDGAISRVSNRIPGTGGAS